MKINYKLIDTNTQLNNAFAQTGFHILGIAFLLKYSTILTKDVITQISPIEFCYQI